MFKIVVATDGSEPAVRAVDYAAEMAVDKKGELIVLSVVPPLPSLLPEGEAFEYYPKLDEDIERFYRDTVSETVKKLKEKHPGLPVSGALRHGNASREIVEAAGELEADLIVVGNRGTGGLLNWMLGSVSRSVVESCTVPVLVVKDREFCDT